MICIYSVSLKETLEIQQQQIFKRIDGNQRKSQKCKIPLSSVTTKSHTNMLHSKQK